MRYGYCTSDAARVETLARLGYDFVERGASALLPFEDAAAWAPARDRIQSAPLPTEALAGFIPAHLKVTGPEVNRAALQRYLEAVIGRAAEIGVEVINWGSAASRLVPDGWPMATAWAQLEEFCHQMADVARGSGVTIVIEPVCLDETNILHYLGEAYALALRVDRPEIRCLVDYYHMERQGEHLTGILLAAPWLLHAHTSGPDRQCPAPGWTQHLFLRALREAGYDRRLSIEARGCDDEALRVALAHLRSTWAEVSVA
jgi:sugar phosphate isomerase/epimerase